MSFLIHFDKLNERIKDYTYFGFFIRKELGSEEIIGICAGSSSIVNKDSVMKKISDTIEELGLPLKIQDDSELNRYFKILNK